MAVPPLKLSELSGTNKPLTHAAGHSWPIEKMTSLHVAIVVYGILIGFNQRLLNDPDTFFHIAAGRWIWAHGVVPTTDPFSLTMQGAPWIAHEWLAELAFAGMYGALGWAGVVVLTAASVTLTYVMLTRFLERLLPPSVTLLFIIASFLLVFPHVLARPHVLDMPILVAWAIGLERSRTAEQRPSYFFLPLMTLWANLHGGFVIGLALAGLYAVDAVITAPDWHQRRQVARGWSLFLLGSILASLITPYGINGPLFAFHLSSQTYSLGLVVEWRSADFSQFGGLEIWILGLLALVFTVPLRLPVLRLVLLLGLIHFALTHIRNADLLALIGPIILAQPLKRAMGDGVSRTPDINPPVGCYLAAAFALAIGTTIASWNGITHDDQRISPTRALAAATASGVDGPVLSAYGFGGYLIFAGIPPFVDGRNDLYRDQFMRDYMDIVTAKGAALSQGLERYHIDWTLLQPDMNAVTMLDHSPDWQRIYADADAVVHRRVAPAAPRNNAPSP